MENKKHEPLFHIAKREQLPWHKAWGIRLLAIVAALIVCAVLTTILTGDNPIEIYKADVSRSFRLRAQNNRKHLKASRFFSVYHLPSLLRSR